MDTSPIHEVFGTNDNGDGGFYRGEDEKEALRAWNKLHALKTGKIFWYFDAAMQQYEDLDVTKGVPVADLQRWNKFAPEVNSAT